MRILCLEWQNVYEKWLKYVKNKTKCKKAYNGENVGKRKEK